MTDNLTILVQLGAVLFIWMTGTAFICSYLVKDTSGSRMTSAQFGAILSLLPPLNILYIVYLIYKRSKVRDESSNRS